MKQMIRLTEGQLHRIIDESVRKVINEIGDTKRGSYMLGRLANKNFAASCRDKASDYDCYMNGYGDESAKTYDSFGDGDEGNRRRIQNNYYRYKIDDLTNKRK